MKEARWGKRDDISWKHMIHSERHHSERYLPFYGGAWFFHWKKAGFLLGLIGALSWAPYYYSPCIILALNGLMVRIGKSSSIKEAWDCGWWWGFGLWFGHLFWAGNSLWVDAERFAWLWPFSLLGLPAVFALYPAVGAMSVKFFQCKTMGGHVYFGFLLGFAWIFSGIEFLMGHLFTGFPWNLLAYIWAPYLPMVQGAAVLGSYGLGLLTFLLLCLPGLFVLQHRSWITGLAWSLGGCALLYGAGSLRLEQSPTCLHAKAVLRLVQPSIAQKEKGDPYFASQQLQTLVRLTKIISKHLPTHVIWPEAAFPWLITPKLCKTFPSFSAATLMMGGVYENTSTQLLNSLMVHEPSKLLVLRYAKMHLLPFGEYIPQRQGLEKLIPSTWLKKITPGSLDLCAGPPSYVTLVEGLPPFRTLICYEAIFPGTVRPPCHELQPQWILNITNDGWFGHSPGPHQHAVSARFRAIEEGLPLVRVANTGTSCMIDPLGRVLHTLPLYVRGIIDSPLPCAIPMTLYARFQETIWVAMMIALGLAILLLQGLQKKRSFQP